MCANVPYFHALLYILLLIVCTNTPCLHILLYLPCVAMPTRAHTAVPTMCHNLSHLQILVCLQSVAMHYTDTYKCTHSVYQSSYLHTVRSNFPNLNIAVCIQREPMHILLSLQCISMYPVYTYYFIYCTYSVYQCTSLTHTTIPTVTYNVYQCTLITHTLCAVT